MQAEVPSGVLKGTEAKACFLIDDLKKLSNATIRRNIGAPKFPFILPTYFYVGRRDIGHIEHKYL